jgi:hypothetical protein
MICAIVSAANAAKFQGYKKGVHQVMFMPLLDGDFAAPIAMVAIMPEAFSDFVERFVADDEYRKPDLEF